MSYVKYDVVCAYRLKHTIYAYDVYIRCRVLYRKELHLFWSRSHWPGPCRPHSSSLHGLYYVVTIQTLDALSLVHDIITDCVGQLDSCL